MQVGRCGLFESARLRKATQDDSGSEEVKASMEIHTFVPKVEYGNAGQFRCKLTNERWKGEGRYVPQQKVVHLVSGNEVDLSGLCRRLPMVFVSRTLQMMRILTKKPPLCNVWTGQEYRTESLREEGLPCCIRSTCTQKPLLHFAHLLRCFISD